MEKKVIPLSLQNDIRLKLHTENIGNDFFLFDDFSDIPLFMHPFKIDMLIVMICTKGSVQGSIDMHPYNLEAPFAIIVLPNQTLHYETISVDFSGYCLFLSKSFMPEFLALIDQPLLVASAIHSTPFTKLEREYIRTIKRYLNALKTFVANSDNPYRLEMVKHLTMIFFYWARPRFQSLSQASMQTRRSILIEHFTKLLSEHFRHERHLDFYAQKLNLTPKYLSQLIKDATGKSASEWIDDFVMLEAKALLNSTGMTIQQISDSLNFPSQSFFGKYFKRCEGISPKRYREKQT